MAVNKVTDRTELAVQPANDDLIHIVDVDDTTDSADGTSKRITVQNLLLGASGGGTSSTLTVRNETGSTLVKGKAVYISGVTGSTPLVTLADNSAASSMSAHGVVDSDISNNTDGTIVIFGVLESVDTSSFAEGDTLYVGTSGNLTATKPTGTALIQNIGVVVRSNASNGSILIEGAGRSNDIPNLPNREVFIGDATGTTEVRAMGSNDLEDMNPGTTPVAGHIFQHTGTEFRGTARVLSGNTDVDTATPNNNDVLTYDTATSLWRPAAGGGGGGGTNYIAQSYAFFDSTHRDVYIPISTEGESTSQQRYNRWVAPCAGTVQSISWMGTNNLTATGAATTVEVRKATGPTTYAVIGTASFSSITAYTGSVATFTGTSAFAAGDTLYFWLTNNFGTSAVFNVSGVILFDVT